MPSPRERRTEPDAPARTFRAVDPGAREVFRRATARVLVIDSDDRVLMFCDSDPGTGATWWITPGGGIDEGETELEAAVRELAEETGHVAAEADLIGPLARRHVVHGYSDRIVDQDDVFYAVRTPPFEVSTAGHTAEELVTMAEHRWWTVEQLAGTDDTIWPAELCALVAAVGHPDEWPVALPDAEESSVPVDQPRSSPG